MTKRTQSLLVLSLALSTASLPATVISVNFSRSTNLPTPLAPTDVAGLVPAANWNNIQSDSQSGSSTTGALADDSGTPTVTQITYFNRFWRDGVDTSTPDTTLNSGYTNTSTTANDTMTVSGLGTEFTSLGYNVIVYLSGTDGMGANTPAEFGANIGGGPDQWIRAIRRIPVSGTFASTTFATEALAEASSTESNYILFTGLTASSFDLNILKDPDSTANWSRAAVKGIQIVSIPEPGAITLLGLGSLGMVLIRRRG